MRVRDGYVAGEGAMLGKLAALVPVVDQRGTPEMAAGALSRYVAEAVWFPTALLPGEHISWKAIDDSAARVIFTDGAVTVSLDVHFGTRGEITHVSMMRHRDVQGTPVFTPWTGHFRNYARVNGMMIPTAGTAEWLLPGGPQAYWRGRTVEVRYESAR
jgi:hypothetical protein